MSKMSEIHATILEQLEDGESMDEIAYSLTCEYPVDFSVAYGWVQHVQANLDEIAKSL